HLATGGGGGGLHRGGAGAVVVRRAVREIEPDDVDAVGDDAFEHARRVSGGAQGGNDLGAARLGFWSHPGGLVDVGERAWSEKSDYTQAARGARGLRHCSSARLSTSASRRPAMRSWFSASGNSAST